MCQERSPCQWRIKQRHRQQTNPCCGQLNAPLSFLTHEDLYHSHDTRIRRFGQPYDSRILLRMPGLQPRAASR
jgi:hypothetical protein